MSDDVTISIALLIDDEPAFRRAAYERALSDGLPEETAKEYLDSEVHSLGQCAVMLLDPGISPAGATILWAQADT